MQLTCQKFDLPGWLDDLRFGGGVFRPRRLRLGQDMPSGEAGLLANALMENVFFCDFWWARGAGTRWLGVCITTKADKWKARMFFFEKKNQKTFTLRPWPGYIQAMAGE